ncbi:MAG: DNA recombination protein RmuC, partial [Prevotellaceae bacterium]|nr:DNA recombination protein RmuC [Prevotellaceae bacterium]
MDIIYFLGGIVIGAAVAAVVARLVKKANGNISKDAYENLRNQTNQTAYQLQVATEKVAEKEQDVKTANEKMEVLRTENVLLQSKISALETTLSANDRKFADLEKVELENKKDLDNKQNEINSLNEKLATANATSQSQGENLLQRKEDNEKQAAQIEALTERITKLTADNSKLLANANALADRLNTQKEEIETMQKTAHLQFEKIATQILDEKSGKFTEVNQKNIEAILKPLGENIDNFKKKVEETFTDETKQRASLDERIKMLVEQTNKVSSEANNLASALKGKAKTQGNWGEMILESILQQSGLEKNREYFAQQSHIDEDGKRFQPDILVNLPDNRTIIIDSKVSLTAYERFSSADTTEEQQIALAEHIKSVRAHIDELSKKKYDDLDKSLDFVMMFVPIEPAYLLAIQNDQSLWSDAYSKRILLISPTNLIACLKIITDLWKRELQSKNAQDIVE